MRRYIPEAYKDYDIFLERAVIGAILITPTAFGSVYGLLDECCFYEHDHVRVYEAMEALFKNGFPIDLATVARQLYDEGMTMCCGNNTGVYLTGLCTNIWSAAHLEYWGMQLRRLAAKRELLNITSRGMEEEWDVLANAQNIEQRLKKVLDVRASDEWLHISQVGLQVSKYMDDMEGRSVQGISTSLPLLDKVNGGYKDGMMVVLGARPGVGKSAMMGQMVVSAAKQGAKVGIMSLEMEGKDVVQRMMSAESDVPFYKIDKGELYDEQVRQQVYGSLGTLSALPIYFSDATQVNIHDIRAKAEKLKNKHGMDILFIDYLQLIEPESAKNRNREQEVSMISRGIKLLAMTLKIPVVILAQLNREAADKEPELYHLRESGSIEQDADVVLFLHRSKNENGIPGEESKLLVRKWRNGSTMDVRLKFEGEVMRFGTVV
jgi:replicative DNA helicase